MGLFKFFRREPTGAPRKSPEPCSRRYRQDWTVKNARSSRNLALCAAAIAVGVAVCCTALPTLRAGNPAAVRLLIAFATVRERRAPPYPMVYFYEHDGVASGKLAGMV